MKIGNKYISILSSLLIATVMLAMPIQAHHSFAMFDMRITKVFTGVVTRIDPAPNHLTIFFAPMNEERTNVERDENGESVKWAVGMGGSAQMAREGVSVNSFPRGTVFSVGLHPARDGAQAGARQGAMFRCPDKTPPKPGKHCDSVEGHKTIGRGSLPEPKG